MCEFGYRSAVSVDDAIEILAREGATACLAAGTTNIMADIRHGRRKPGVLVDISRLAELSGIAVDGGIVRIGALSTIAQIASSPVIADLAPALSDAARHFADPVTRNKATIGGNIAHASPAADCAPPLLAYGADVLIMSSGGCRKAPLSEFFLGVNSTILAYNEIIAAFEMAPCKSSSFIKVGLRNAMAISVASVAVALSMGPDGCIDDCRVAFGSLAARPVRAFNVEEALRGQKPGGAALEGARAALAQDISPIDDVRATGEYRLSVAGTIMERAVAASSSRCASVHMGGCP